MKEMKCKRCGANENRIHGFCSMECETAWEYEDEIRDLAARIAELEAERDDWRKSYINLWRHINNLPQPPEVQE